MPSLGRARLLRALPFLLCGLGVAATLGPFLVPARSASPRFAATFDSPEALAREVVSAVQAGDAERLAALPLSEDEFRDHVWPEMPASRGIPVEYAWSDLSGKSGRSLQTSLANRAGRPLSVTGVEFLKRPTTYETFVVHRRARIHVRDEAGRPLSIDVIGSILQDGDRYKLFSYVVDR